MKPPTSQYSHLIRLILLAPLASLLTGCAGISTSDLTSINKDWNKLIRASHIYPIYPLTQDIQPGDVFLTDTSLEDTRAWEKVGYVRFDHHVTRLYPTNYAAFYQHSFGIGDEDLPKSWLHDNSWTEAPAAAFPSYSFSVKQGGGVNVALPISGIPIGLGLMGARSASGFVSIGDARTYGVDETTLMGQVEEYVHTHAPQLQKCLGVDFVPGPEKDHRFFLQVVCRVYTTGKVTVSMVNDSSFGGSLSGGAPKDVPIPDAQSTNAAANYANLVSAVNTNVNALTAIADQAGKLAPGGTIKFAAVSSRSVSMSETFTNPLVIGYTGFTWPLEIVANTAAAPGDSPVKVRLQKDGARSIKQYLNRKN